MPRSSASSSPPSTSRVLAEKVAALEEELVLADRLLAAIRPPAPQAERGLDAMDAHEVETWHARWGSDHLQACLRAGVTVLELKVALRTGVPPDSGVVAVLAMLRGHED